MSTRCYIGQKIGNDVRFIYCHYDGYPSGVGHTLVKYYDTEEKVTDLLDHGDRMTLCENVDDGKYDEKGLAIKLKPDDDSARTVSHLTWSKFHQDNGIIEFYYLFDDGKWTCRNHEWKLIDINRRKFRLRDDTKVEPTFVQWTDFSNINLDTVFDMFYPTDTRAKNMVGDMTEHDAMQHLIDTYAQVLNVYDTDPDDFIIDTCDKS